MRRSIFRNCVNHGQNESEKSVTPKEEKPENITAMLPGSFPISDSISL